MESFMIGIARILLVGSIISIVAGCKIGAAVFEGGDVISDSGTRHCFEGQTCEFQVNDTSFTETFTAQPRTGFEFTKWMAGDGFLCADSTNPSCTVSNVALAGNSTADVFIASDSMFYIMPEFTCVIEYCLVRPDPNYAALDDAIVAMDEAKTIIEEYVARNDSYASPISVFGINTWSHSSISDVLEYIDILPNPLVRGESIYITAAVPKCVWLGGCTTAYDADVAFFSLSGSTNADNSFTWNCIPRHPDEAYVPNGPNAIPEVYLPVACRG
jgi:hypothetical protein